MIAGPFCLTLDLGLRSRAKQKGPAIILIGTDIQQKEMYRYTDRWCNQSGSCCNVASCGLYYGITVVSF